MPGSFARKGKVLFITTSAPICRFALELWWARHDLDKPRDTFIVVELYQAYKLIREAMEGQGAMVLEQGPLRAAAGALVQLGWRFESPDTLADATGTIFDLSYGSPQMLRGSVAKALDQKRRTQWQEAYDGKHDPMPIKWPLVERYFRSTSKRTTSGGKAVLLMS